MVLSILQWNARSLCSNGQEFKKYIEELSEKPNVICVQETWLRPHLDFIIRGYVAVRRDRGNGSGGGVATFIKHGLGFRTLNISKDAEAILIEAWIGNTSVRIVNFYNPCEKLSREMLGKIIGKETHKTVWCGDFNAYSTLWGSGHQILMDVL